MPGANITAMLNITSITAPGEDKNTSSSIVSFTTQHQFRDILRGKETNALLEML